jgi:hypothetical protein
VVSAEQGHVEPRFGGLAALDDDFPGRGYRKMIALRRRDDRDAKEAQ